MATFLITSIKATPGLHTTRSDNSVSIPGTPETIWQPGTSYKDGTGSKLPITFKSASTDATITPDLVLNGNILLSKEWVSKKYHIEGSLNVSGTVNVIFKGPDHDAPPVIPDPGLPVVITDEKFKFANPTSDHVCPVPYHLVGDFTWTVVSATGDEIKFPTTTLLELNWAIASAPNGPTFNPDKKAPIKFNIDLQGSYPIRLFRFFLPLSVEIPQEDFLTRYKKWWVSWIMTKIWNYGNPGNPALHILQYDNVQGGSSYNVGSCGGSFELTKWVDTPSQFLNCYDLAGIAELGCCLLIATDGSNALDSKWVYQDPYGYILPGALYGWQSFGPCNNPFWKATIGMKPLVPDTSTTTTPMPDTRYPFGNHAWIEAVTEDDTVGTKVLDATVANWTTGSAPWPENGTRNRAEYQTAHVALTLPGAGNIRDRMSGVPSSDGSCYLNDTWLLAYNTQRPTGGMPRIGIYSADGLMTPIYYNRPVNYLPLPPIPVAIPSLPIMASSFASLNFIANAGGNIASPTDEADNINDAPLTETAVSNLVSTNTNLIYHRTRSRIEPGITQVEYYFTDATQTGANGDLTVTIKVFSTTAATIPAFVGALSGFQLPLSDITRPLPSPIGQHSIATRRNIYFIRYNLLITLSFETLELPSEADFNSAIKIAQGIDEHVSARTNAPGFRAPSTDLVKLVKKASVGDVFELKCSEVSNLAGVTSVRSNDPDIVSPSGPAIDGVFRLYALGKGETDVVFTVAHAETLLPASRHVKITIE